MSERESILDEAARECDEWYDVVQKFMSGYGFFRRIRARGELFAYRNAAGAIRNLKLPPDER